VKKYEVKIVRGEKVKVKVKKALEVAIHVF
jgi:hypothetical protein